METNLLSGPVLPRLARFALPILLANLLQTCYSMADMAVVGRFVGSEGLAGVSSAAMDQLHHPVRLHRPHPGRRGAGRPLPGRRRRRPPSTGR